MISNWTTATNSYVSAANWGAINTNNIFINKASSGSQFTIKTTQPSIPIISNIKIFNSNKVVGITFNNGKKIKTICDNRDFFSLEYACFLAYAKLLYSKEYTHEGVLNKAEELQTKKEFIKLVKQGINKYKEEERLKIKKEKEEAEKKAIKIRKIEKAARKRKKSQEAQIKNIANIMKETLNE